MTLRHAARLAAPLALLAAGCSGNQEVAPGSLDLGLTLVIVAASFFAITLGAGRVLVRMNRRRRTEPTDEGGLRSVATARAPFVKTVDDLATLVAQQLTAELVAPSPVESSDDGTVRVLPVDLAGASFVLRLSLADGSATVRVCDRGAANRPAAESRFAPLPSTDTTRLLDRVDRALRQSPAFENVRWHPRERFDRGDLGGADHAPHGA